MKLLRKLIRFLTDSHLSFRTVLMSVIYYIFCNIMNSPAQSSGYLDFSFGSGGIVTTSVGPAMDQGRAVHLQPDGKIILSGGAQNGTDWDFAVVRYNTNGSLDSSFGANGKVITPVGIDNDMGFSGFLQPDGKIVVAGDSYNATNYDFGLIRYNPNGSLDNSFGTGGIVTTNVSVSNDYCRGALLQPDGKMILTGLSYNGSNYDIATVRYNTDGSLDSTFGSSGVVMTAIGSTADYGWALALQQDGKILVAGRTDNPTDIDIALLRYQPNGTPDSSFGTNGIVISAPGPADDIAHWVLVQPNGKIVVSGYFFNGTDNDVAVLRYNPDGSPDNSFGTNGIVTTPVGPAEDYSFSANLQPDGKIIVAGRSGNGSDDDFSLLRYTGNGSLDSTFGTNGKVTTPVGSANDFGYTSILTPEGRIILAGYYNNGIDSDFALARYMNCAVPVILTEPVDQTACSGENLLLTVSATGDSALTYQWYHDSIIIAGATDDSLIINNISATGAGHYFCIVTNPCSGDTSNNALLTVHPIYFHSENVSVCNGDSILFNGTYLYNSGTYYDTLQTVNGCDSIFELMLSVLPDYTDTIYTTICSGDSIFLAGGWQYLPGNYYDSLLMVNGCDSITHTFLVIQNTSQAGTGTIDTVCYFSNYLDLFGILTPPFDSGGVWTDDDISGALSGSIFNPGLAGPGEYDFTYSVSGSPACPDTSATVTVIVEPCNGISEETNNTMLFYPNPSEGKIVVILNTALKNAELNVSNMVGQLVQTENIPSINRIVVDLTALPKGIYHIIIRSDIILLNGTVIID